MSIWRRRNENTEPETADVDLDAARIRFFANIVDELRSPLTIILSQISAAIQEVDGEARNHQLRDAERNAKRLERLASQASDLTRLDAGTLRLGLRAVELVPFVDSLVMSFEDLADRNGIVLEFYARRKSIRGYVDPDHLTTIVANLMSNAVKFTPGGGRIGVALDFVPPDLMQLTVVDSGVGIAKDRQATLFDPFVRTSEDGRDKKDGAGIGLPLARSLAKLHGGDIEVESDSGRGCRFVVSLPLGIRIDDFGDELLLGDVSRPEVTAEILFRSTVQTVPDSLPPGIPTILMVDADNQFRAWAVDALSEVAGVDVEATVDTAIDSARDMLPDLILCSDKNPGCDGVGMTRALRSDERTSHIAVILIGAQSDSTRRIAAFDAGADDYLEKPIDSRELQARVRSTLDRLAELRRQFREQVVIRPADICERSVDQKFLEKVTSTIEMSMDVASFSVQDLGDAVAMSTSQLSRKLRALVDQSPAQLIRRMRLQRAADLVAASAGRITDICFQVGFVDQSHFSRSFKRHFGVSPAEYRRKQAAKRHE